MVPPILLAIFSLHFISAANSFEFPVRIPFFTPTPSYNNTTRRIAIIGAGAAGSSAAYWLSRAADRHPGIVDIAVDLYEKESYIGGRKCYLFVLFLGTHTPFFRKHGGLSAQFRQL